MLLDTRKENANPEGFSPNVQNEIIEPKKSGGTIAVWVLLGIITIGLFPLINWFTKKNWFNKMQMKANEATSGIDVQLAQRRDTLVKLVDATKSSMKFEHDLLVDVTQLRSMKIEPKNAVEASNKIENNFGRFLATFEKYPELQSTKTIRDLMESADYQERELAASRRLYNSIANQFNEELFTWQGSIPACSMKLHTLPLFVASAIQRQDVSLDLTK